jgi:hypothetical protein
VAKQTKAPKERSLSPYNSNADYLSFALDRIAVLEQLVSGLVLGQARTLHTLIVG